MSTPTKNQPVAPKRGDRVRASSYRTRASGRELIAVRHGVVEMVYRDQVWVRIVGLPQPLPFPIGDVEVMNGAL